ncbi:MAG: long-chain fatty acid--CoA ligase [Bradymonadales bacterium]|nr:long-chain fatty acid--CoA ligase [Bradymonadales bacterium]
MNKRQFATLVEMQRQSCETFADQPLFGTKRSGQYEWTTYRQFGQMIDKCRGGLAKLGIERGDRVAIIANNSVEWAVGAYATYGLGAIWIPMYERQLIRDWEYILRDSAAKVLIVRNQEILQKMSSFVEQVETLENVIKIEEAEEGGWSWLLEEGGMNPVEPIGDLHTDDIAGILYTSGTTGVPKGVMLSHGNFIHNVNGANQLYDFDRTDVSLCFLPWAHSLGQTCDLHALMCLGLSMGFAESVETLVDNMLEVRPTVLIAVPRIFNRIYDRLQKKIQEGSPIARFMFQAGMKAAKEKRLAREKGQAPGLWLNFRHNLFDKLVFAKVRERFGGRLRFAISGGAALSKDVAQFIDDMNITVFEGYGLTETAPIVTANRPDARRIGSVGKPFPDVEVVIDGAKGQPEVEGEVLVSGPNVMKGYYNLPEETEAVLFDQDGKRFFRTGDLGKFDKDGYLYITGRVKELYKLANGMYISPSPIEEKLQLSKFFSQVFLYGANKPFNIALIVPDKDSLVKWAQESGLGEMSFEKLCCHEKVRELVHAELEKAGAEIKPFERPRAFHLLTAEFSLDNELLTPSLKVKRKKVAEKYQQEIDTLYQGSED